MAEKHHVTWESSLNADRMEQLHRMSAEAEAGGWVVTWLGLEPATGCVPLVNLDIALALGISI